MTAIDLANLTSTVSTGTLGNGSLSLQVSVLVVHFD